MKPFQIEIDINEKDYINFNLYHSKHSHKNGRIRLLIKIATIVILLAISLPAIFSAENMGSRFMDFLPLYVAAVLFLFYIAPLFQKLLIKKSIKNLLSEGPNNSIFCKRTLIINEKQLIEVSETQETKLNIDVIHKIEQDKNYYFIYVSSISAYIIPKNDKYNNNIEELKEYLKNNFWNK